MSENGYKDGYAPSLLSLPSPDYLERKPDETYAQFCRREAAAKYQRKRIISGYVIAYICIGFLNFGWFWNHNALGQNDINGKWQFSPANTTFVGLVSSIFWPIYQGGRFAIWVTKWP